MVFPGSERGVEGDGGGVLFCGGEKLAAAEPTDGRLNGAFGDADVLGEFLIADLNGSLAAGLLRGKPKINEKTDGAMVVTDEIAEEHVGDVVVDDRHG